MGRLIAVSNRTAADPNSRAGGLAVALWDALVKSSGLWFGWSGAIVDGPSRGVSMFQDEGVDFLLADLSEEERQGFYYSYSNSLLWPVFHYRNDLARFVEDDFRIYSAVNDRFARLVSARAREGDIVWIHDYHFLLLGAALRRAGWSGRTGFFLHIPFPPPELFRTVPQHHEIAEALCACDVIGFQSANDRANFVRYLEEYCDARAEQESGFVKAFGRRVKIDVYPIGIDVESFRASVSSDAAQAAIRRLRRGVGERQHVIGVDRLDYSKGLPERFAAIGRLLDDYPEARGKMTMTQIAPPSRSSVEEYQELRNELDALSGRINGDYGDLDWTPLRYLVRGYQREELAGLYSVSRVGLVTPLRDGMNLVAKEYVAAQDPDDPGVLILSEFAGAAEQLSEALLVNPYDSAGLAAAINAALHMPLDERRARWKRLFETVRQYDIAWWREKFLADLRDGDAAGPRD
ncbi:MAG: trehalose-6-phosphate synthase [Alphaproteobacteria bacterium]|nr:trehalose-6-phosphate synthase [Alphaproteobacteria bacterium]